MVFVSESVFVLIYSKCCLVLNMMSCEQCKSRSFGVKKWKVSEKVSIFS